VLRFIFCLLSIISFTASAAEKVTLITASPSSSRIAYGAGKLASVLIEKGYQVNHQNFSACSRKSVSIIIGQYYDPVIRTFLENESLKLPPEPGKEGYSIVSGKHFMMIAGSDASGALYGCMELADSIRRTGRLPEHFNKTDQPEMVIRGACIGMQKTTFLPGRDVYEYPYTPENFPWFYDKNLWINYLDMLAGNRLNALYLWNGHPFASLVRLEDYPYAVEVDDSTFKRNEELFSFLTTEADKRGIWVIQMFYNIIVSKPFAEHHGIKTQDRNRPITPLLSDYTRKSIAAFVAKYPNVGLMVCLGEAINTIEDDIEWFTKTIIPGVKDGLAMLGKTTEPPLILRGHDTEPQRVLAAALPLYRNLCTMQKYNGESLTTYQPRGTWASVHQSLSRPGSVHISNVHILANLEPFRYGSPEFIQKCVQAMHDIQGANGLHLYPQASYWDWPHTADKTSPRLLEMERDWIWYQGWARYAWNCRRDKQEETEFWTEQLEKYYGCTGHGNDILKAYTESGQISPKLLRRFGISDGNRQTLLLGMFMSQLVNPYKWRVYSNFYNSNGPEGEILVDWAKKEWTGEAHIGETPPQIVQEVLEHGRIAKEAIIDAEPYIGKNQEEFKRLKNDIFCYNAIARFYVLKVNAAMLVLKYRYSGNVSDLEQALAYLEKSVTAYYELTDLTKGTYIYANSMQTGQRRIPIEGTNGKNKTWEELLPHYITELDNFRTNIDKLKNTGDTSNGTKPLLIPASVVLHDKEYGFFELKKGDTVFSDQNYSILGVTPELKNLKGLRLNYNNQLKEGTSVRFSSEHPVKVVVGYFNGNSTRLLTPPALETNAGANDRGQGEIRIANALDIDGLFPVNIYTYDYEPGEHRLQLGKGICLVLGFIDGKQEISTYEAGIGAEDGAGIDWLFY
jgi:hypothetical protein